MKKQHILQNEKIIEGETSEKNLPDTFFDLLNKAILYSPKEDQTSESQNSCDYSDKQIRPRKYEDISDLRNDKCR